MEDKEVDGQRTVYFVVSHQILQPFAKNYKSEKKTFYLQLAAKLFK